MPTTISEKMAEGKLRRSDKTLPRPTVCRARLTAAPGSSVATRTRRDRRSHRPAPRRRGDAAHDDGHTLDIPAADKPLWPTRSP